MPKHHLIVGGGPAGIYALETIRELDEGASSITLISDEPAYARMALPYFMAGEIPEEQLYIGDEAFFQRMGVTPILGKRVTGVNPKANRVTLEDGSSLQYDDLLIATGASAQRLPIPGFDLPGVHTLWTLDDAHQAMARGRPGANVVLVGAGFIGFIVLNAMFKVGCHLKVVELEDHVLPRMIDSRSADLVRKWLRGKGIEIHTGTSVVEIGLFPDGRKNVRLSNGTALTADLVILATGIKANLDLTRDSGIQVEEGIVVNNRMQTNFPNIYAAGDVAQGPDLSTGRRAVHAIQPTAVDHGRVAGGNMAGLELNYPGSLLMNILDVVGLHCASFGQWHDDSRETVTRINLSRPIYRKLLWEGDRMVGAIFIGPANDLSMLNDVGMVKGIIQTRVELGHWKDYVNKNPLDVRRAYVAKKVAARLLETTLSGRSSRDRGFRFGGIMPQTRPTAAHRTLIATRPDVKLL